MNTLYWESTKAFVVATVIFFCILTGNQWFTEAGVLKTIQLSYPYYGPVKSTELHVLDKSRFIVRSGSGQVETFCLDTDLFFNYKVEVCKK